MSEKKSVVAEAIADAKEFKKMAIENARLSLAESVTPAIAALLSQKLTEDFDKESEEGDEDVKEPENEAFNALMEKLKEEDPEKYEAVSAALAEKKAPEKEEEVPKEAGEEEKEPEEEALDIEAALAEVEKGQAESDDSVKEEEADKPAEEEPAEEPESDDDDIDEDYISRIMAEVEEEGNDAEPDKDADDKDGEEVPMDENLVTDAAKKLKDFIAANLKGLSPADMKKAVEQGAGYTILPSNLEAKEEKPAEEAPEEIKTEELLELKDQLFEMNLLAAKLMFQNKLLLKEGITDSQKARIIVAFDKAKTVNEVKLIAETLEISKTKPKAAAKPLAESLGFRRIGPVAPVKSEKASYDVNDPIVQEMQKRAGIKKH